VPDDFIDRVFAVMALTPRHTYQVLTKRAEQMRDYVLRITYDDARSESFYAACDEILEGGGSQAMDQDWPLPNVWLGVSVENQHFADERIPLLLQTPAVVRFLSCEPLLGPLDLERALLIHRHWKSADSLPQAPWCPDDPAKFWYEPQALRGINQRTPDWVIVGGESGAGARPLEIAWARAIVRQCQAAGVACFVKQLGANVWHTIGIEKSHERAAVRNRKGGDPAEWPEDLRVREFPAGPA
jgi:protein gp37